MILDGVHWWRWHQKWSIKRRGASGNGGSRSGGIQGVEAGKGKFGQMEARGESLIAAQRSRTPVPSELSRSPLPSECHFLTVPDSTVLHTYISG